jgi:hypothetical protein
MDRACFAALVTVAGLGLANAMTLIVTNTGDSGSGSLRQAITDFQVAHRSDLAVPPPICRAGIPGRHIL